MSIDQQRRLFLKQFSSLTLLGLSASNSACTYLSSNRAEKRDRYLIGSVGNTFYSINLNSHQMIAADIGFVGHSFLQNPVNRAEIIIPEKTSSSWCTVNLLDGSMINRVYKSSFTFYGHFAFSADRQSLFLPRYDNPKRQMSIEILDPRNYQSIDLIPVPDVVGFHDLHYNPHSSDLVISTVGFFDSKGQKTNGILVFDPIKNRVKQKIPTYTHSAYPTHLLPLNPYEYLVSMEVPEGHEESLGAKKDANGKYIIVPQTRRFDIRSDAEAKPIIFDKKFDDKLFGNIPYLNKIVSQKKIYLGNPHTDTIFVINIDNLNEIETLNVKSKGLAVLNDQLYVCSEKNLSFPNVVNAHNPNDPLLNSIHFNVVEI